MQNLKNKTNIDFIASASRHLHLLGAQPAILVGIGRLGLQPGVDFAGGTVVEVQFEQAHLRGGRAQARRVGWLHDVSVQSIGSADENSFLPALGGVTQLTEENAGKAREAIQALGPVRNLYPGPGQRASSTLRSEQPSPPAD
jgi:preprotein translocase subunit SecF